MTAAVLGVTRRIRANSPRLKNWQSVAAIRVSETLQQPVSGSTNMDGLSYDADGNLREDRADGA